MRKLSIIVSVLAALAFLSTCEYNPTEVNYVEIDPHYSLPQVDVKLPWYEDTVYVDAGYLLNFVYTIEGEKEKFLKVIVYLDSAKHSESSLPEGWFMMDLSSDQYIKSYEISMQMFFRSGTGSLADRVGAEGSMAYKKWTIIAYNFRNFKAPELKFENVDGNLKISWDKIDYPHISRVMLRKDIGLDMPPSIDLANLSSDASSFFDDSFIGEKANYVLTYVTDKDKWITFPVTLKEKELPKLKVVDNNGSVRLEWTKCPYYNNFLSYNIYKADDYIKDRTFVDINKLSYDYGKIPLFSRMYFEFSITPKKKIDHHDYGHENYYTTLLYERGDSSFAFDAR